MPSTCQRYGSHLARVDMSALTERPCPTNLDSANFSTTHGVDVGSDSVPGMGQLFECKLTFPLSPFYGLLNRETSNAVSQKVDMVQVCDREVLPKGLRCGSPSNSHPVSGLKNGKVKVVVRATSDAIQGRRLCLGRGPSWP
ncbi:hypothetical protein Bbelb_440150 [Branchiostoma belcheri]|nr:hypothetical protein Bbelb_440150 [Branchiostoma belcheri]